MGFMSIEAEICNDQITSNEGAFYTVKEHPYKGFVARTDNAMGTTGYSGYGATEEEAIASLERQTARKASRIANYLFAEMCWHDCELKNWYADGLHFITPYAEAETQALADSTSEAETKVRGCGCNELRDMRIDIRPELRASAQAQIHN